MTGRGDGVTEELLTEVLRYQAEVSRQGKAVEAADIARHLARYVFSAVERAVGSLPADQRGTAGVELTNAIVDGLAQAAARSGLSSDDHLAVPAELVTFLGDASDSRSIARPVTPLSETHLFMNAPDEPRVASEIGRELLSSDSADALVAFVKWSGLQLIEDQIREFLDSGRRLRVITTTYIGATERRALDELVRLGAEVKVAYDNRSTRLHAKAWLFRRASGLDTAWIGSSNLSRAALVDGLEWNIRASRATTPDVLDKFIATFDTYWAESHFETYDPATDAERFDEAVGVPGVSTRSTSRFSTSGRIPSNRTCSTNSKSNASVTIAGGTLSWLRPEPGRRSWRPSTIAGCGR